MSNHRVTVHQLTANFGTRQVEPYLNVLCNDYHWLGVKGHLLNGQHWVGVDHKLCSVIFVCLENQEPAAQLEMLKEQHPGHTWQQITATGMAKS